MFRLFCHSAFLLSIFCALIYGDEDPYPYRFEGIFEDFKDKRLEMIAKFLPYNPIILEAGAHYGEDTLNLIKRWPPGSVLAFEPNPDAYEKLSIHTNGYNNVFTYNLGLSDKVGKALFYVCYGTGGDDPIFEGASSLLPPSESMEIHYQGPTIEVDCVILDDWCKKNGIDHIDFISLDINGMELQVLKSSPEILNTVKIIYTKTNMYPFRVNMTQYSDLRKFLEESGFILFSHWYREGLMGDAIFLKADIFYAVFGGSN